MTTIVLVVLGALFLASRLQQGGTAVPLFQPKTPYTPWSEATPSSAGSIGTGETNPLTAILMRLQGQLAPAPYVPLSGPGGASVSPGASSAPAGRAQNTLQAAAPATEPTYSILQGDLALASDPQYYWMMPTIDVAIMSDDLNGALAAAGDIDLSQTMVEASIGAVWR